LYHKICYYIESGLKLLGLDLASLATQGVGAGAQPNAYTGYGKEYSENTKIENGQGTMSPCRRRGYLTLFHTGLYCCEIQMNRFGR